MYKIVFSLLSYIAVVSTTREPEAEESSLPCNITYIAALAVAQAGQILNGASASSSIDRRQGSLFPSPILAPSSSSSSSSSSSAPSTRRTSHSSTSSSSSSAFPVSFFIAPCLDGWTPAPSALDVLLSAIAVARGGDPVSGAQAIVRLLVDGERDDGSQVAFVFESNFTYSSKNHASSSSSSSCANSWPPSYLFNFTGSIDSINSKSDNMTHNNRRKRNGDDEEKQTQYVHITPSPIQPLTSAPLIAPPFHATAALQVFWELYRNTSGVAGTGAAAAIDFLSQVWQPLFDWHEWIFANRVVGSIISTNGGGTSSSAMNNDAVHSGGSKTTTIGDANTPLASIFYTIHPWESAFPASYAWTSVLTSTSSFSSSSSSAAYSSYGAMIDAVCENSTFSLPQRPEPAPRLVQVSPGWVSDIQYRREWCLAACLSSSACASFVLSSPAAAQNSRSSSSSSSSSKHSPLSDTQQFWGVATVVDNALFAGASESFAQISEWLQSAEIGVVPGIDTQSASIVHIPAAQSQKVQNWRASTAQSMLESMLLDVSVYGNSKATTTSTSTTDDNDDDSQIGQSWLFDMLIPLANTQGEEEPSTTTITTIVPIILGNGTRNTPDSWIAGTGAMGLLLQPNPPRQGYAGSSPSATTTFIEPLGWQTAIMNRLQEQDLWAWPQVPSLSRSSTNYTSALAGEGSVWLLTNMWLIDALTMAATSASASASSSSSTTSAFTSGSTKSSYFGNPLSWVVKDEENKNKENAAPYMSSASYAADYLRYESRQTVCAAMMPSLLALFATGMSSRGTNNNNNNNIVFPSVFDSRSGIALDNVTAGLVPAASAIIALLMLPPLVPLLPPPAYEGVAYLITMLTIELIIVLAAAIICVLIGARVIMERRKKAYNYYRTKRFRRQSHGDGDYEHGGDEEDGGMAKKKNNTTTLGEADEFDGFAKPFLLSPSLSSSLGQLTSSINGGTSGAIYTPGDGTLNNILTPQQQLRSGQKKSGFMLSGLRTSSTFGSVSSRSNDGNSGNNDGAEEPDVETVNNVNAENNTTPSATVTSQKGTRSGRSPKSTLTKQRNNDNSTQRRSDGRNNSREMSGNGSTNTPNNTFAGFTSPLSFSPASSQHTNMYSPLDASPSPSSTARGGGYGDTSDVTDGGGGTILGSAVSAVGSGGYAIASGAWWAVSSLVTAPVALFSSSSSTSSSSSSAGSQKQ